MRLIAQYKPQPSLDTQVSCSPLLRHSKCSPLLRHSSFIAIKQRQNQCTSHPPTSRAESGGSERRPPEQYSFLYCPLRVKFLVVAFEHPPLQLLPCSHYSLPRKYAHFPRTALLRSLVLFVRFINVSIRRHGLQCREQEVERMKEGFAAHKR